MYRLASITFAHIALPRFLLLFGVLLLALIPAATRAGEVNISHIMPAVLAPGQSATLIVEGEGFAPGCGISFQPWTVQAEEVRVLTPFNMEVDVQVADAAVPGPVVVSYFFGGITETFPGLLDIVAPPQITDISPSQLFGPQPTQELTVSGQYLNAEWVAALDVSAVLLAAGTTHDLDESVSYMNSTAFRILLDTPMEHYAAPCSVLVQITDPEGTAYSFDVPVEVAAPPAVPEIDSVSVVLDGPLALGSYPLVARVSLTVSGSNLDATDPATLQLSGHTVAHLELPAGSHPLLSGLTISETEITADLEFAVADDDRSFAPSAAATGVLELGDLSEPFSYSAELLWPGPALDSLEVETAGVITGSETGGAVTLDGAALAVTATIVGDYLRALPGAEVMLTSAGCAFEYESELQFAPDTRSALANIIIIPTSLPAVVPAVQFELAFNLGGESLATTFSLPVELEQLVPEIALSAAEFLPAGPLAQPAGNAGVLQVRFTGEMLDMLEFAPETIQLECDEGDFAFSVVSLEQLTFGPSQALARYQISFGAPDVSNTPLALSPAVDDIVVPYEVKLRYQEFSDAFSATFFTTGAFELLLSYPPAFDGIELAGPPLEVGPATYSLPLVITGENLLPKYLDAAGGMLVSAEAAHAPAALTGLEITGGSSTALTATATFSLADWLADDPTPREEECTLTLTETYGSSELVSSAFALALGLSPVFSGIVVTYPAEGAPVEAEFDLEFTLAGSNLAPGYIDGASASLRILDPPQPATFSLEPVELVSLESGLAEARTAVQVVECAAGAPLLAELTVVPNSAGAVALRAQFMLELAAPAIGPGPGVPPALNFSVPAPARLLREGGAAWLELPLTTSAAAPSDLPLHAVVSWPSDEQLEFDFELSAGQRLSETFEVEATALFDALLEAQGAASLAAGVSPLRIEFSCPEQPEFAATATEVPCRLAVPLRIMEVTVAEVQPAELELDGDSGVEFAVLVRGDNLDTAEFQSFTRFAPSGTPIRCETSVQQAAAAELELRAALDSAAVLELVGDLALDTEEVQGLLEVQALGIGGASAEGSAQYLLALPPAAAPQGLALVIDESQRLAARCQSGSGALPAVQVEIEVALEYLSAAGPVRNIRGLRFDESAAEAACALEVDGTEYAPAEVRRRTESLLALSFEVPQSALAETGATPATLTLEPEDLAFAFEPLLSTDQRTLALDVPLRLSGVGAGGAAALRWPQVRVTLARVEPASPEELYRGDLAFLRFTWDAVADFPPVLNDDGRLIGFDVSQETAEAGLPLDLRSCCDIINELQPVACSIYSTQKGARTIKPELLEFQPDGTAVVGLDISSLPEGAEFEIELDVKEEAPLDPIPWGPFGIELEPPGGEVAPRMVTTFFVSELIIPGWKPKEMTEQECYAAREEYEKAKGEAAAADEECDCEDEYQAYLDALAREEAMASERRNAGDRWEINQESRYIVLQRERMAAWDAYVACSEKEVKAEAKMKVAEAKSWGCTAPVKTDGTGQDEDDDAVPDEEEEHRSVGFTASASGERSYAVGDFELEYHIPSELARIEDRNPFGHYDFSVVAAAELAGTAVLADTGHAFAFDPDSGEVVFGGGATGARLPASEFQFGDTPGVDVAVSDPRATELLFVPLYNQFAEPEMGIGVAIGAGAEWPAGWNEVGSGATLGLEPWSELGRLPEPAQVTSADLQLEFTVELRTPAPAGAAVRGELLFAEYSWRLSSNVRMSLGSDWSIALDPGAASPGPLPVLLNAGLPGEAEAGIARWSAGGPPRLAGAILRDGAVVGEYAIELQADGTATLVADLGGLERGVDYELGDPEVTPADEEAAGDDGAGDFLNGDDDWNPWEEIAKEFAKAIPFGGTWPWFFFPSPEDYQADCDAAIEELAELEADDCDCSEEEAALDAALAAYLDALEAWIAADAALQAATQAKANADQAKADADQAVTDAEQAEKDAQAELERYINEEVPGASAASGDASQAGSHAAGSSHAAGFACGNNFIGVSIGDDAAWRAHQAGINSRMTTWRNAYQAAKQARKNAEAAGKAADQAAADLAQAQAAYDAADAAYDAALAAYDAAYAAWLACLEACEEHDALVADARTRIAMCEYMAGMDDESADEDEDDGADDGGNGDE